MAAEDSSLEKAIKENDLDVSRTDFSEMEKKQKKSEVSKFNFSEMEKKWQKRWEEARIYESEVDETKPKFFMIFAYPGISGYLHVGHMRGYTYTDVITRYKRMRGYNVLFPVGTHATGNLAIAFLNKVKEKNENWIRYLKENGATEMTTGKGSDFLQIGEGSPAP